MCHVISFPCFPSLLIIAIVEFCTAESCDSLTACIKQESGVFKCTECPVGFNGTGLSGCFGMLSLEIVLPLCPFSSQRFQ